MWISIPWKGTVGTPAPTLFEGQLYILFSSCSSSSKLDCELFGCWDFYYISFGLLPIDMCLVSTNNWCSTTACGTGWAHSAQRALCSTERNRRKYKLLPSGGLQSSWTGKMWTTTPPPRPPQGRGGGYTQCNINCKSEYKQLSRKVLWKFRKEKGQFLISYKS